MEELLDCWTKAFSHDVHLGYLNFKVVASYVIFFAPEPRVKCKYSFNTWIILGNS